MHLRGEYPLVDHDFVDRAKSHEEVRFLVRLGPLLANGELDPRCGDEDELLREVREQR